MNHPQPSIMIISPSWTLIISRGSWILRADAHDRAKQQPLSCRFSWYQHDINQHRKPDARPTIQCHQRYEDHEDPDSHNTRISTPPWPGLSMLTMINADYEPYRSPWPSTNHQHQPWPSQHPSQSWSPGSSRSLLGPRRERKETPRKASREDPVAPARGEALWKW